MLRRLSLILLFFLLIFGVIAAAFYYRSSGEPDGSEPFSDRLQSFITNEESTEIPQTSPEATPETDSTPLVTITLTEPPPTAVLPVTNTPTGDIAPIQLITSTETATTSTPISTVSQPPSPTAVVQTVFTGRSATPVPQNAGSTTSVRVLGQYNGEPIITAVVRSGPGVGYKAVDLVHPQTYLPVVGLTGWGTGTWYYVRTPKGRLGWISVQVAQPNR